MNPKTAQQINDPQTGKVSTSRHSALSEMMIQNAELREQLRLVQLANGDLDASNRQLREQLAVIQTSYDALSQIKEKSVASRIEVDELKEENDSLKAENARLASQIELMNVALGNATHREIWVQTTGGQLPDERLKAENTDLKQKLSGHEIAAAALVEKVENLEADNARLAAIAIQCDEVIDELSHHWATHRNEFDRFDLVQQRITELRLSREGALRDLLAPTIEVIEAAKYTLDSCGGYVRRPEWSTEPPKWTYLEACELLDNELDRLRGLVEWKP